LFLFSYTYWLELDANNNILGGTFTTWDRVDFVWAPREVSERGRYREREREREREKKRERERREKREISYSSL
jgi:hypothetical protein